MTTDRLPTYTLENGTHLESAPSRNLHQIALARIFPRLRRDYGHCIASAERNKVVSADGVLSVCPPLRNASAGDDDTHFRSGSE